MSIAPLASSIERQALFVLGMHRSGTSALTRVLSLLGCDTPRTLIAPDGNNEKGYWESDVLRVLNDAVLASGGSDWRDWRAFNPHWIVTVRAGEFREKALAALASEYGSSRLFVFKDPRACRIVPFWKSVFDAFGAEMKVVIPFRNPLEVIASLVTRDHMPTELAALLWLRHIIDAERDTRGMARLFLNYETFLSEWPAKLEAMQDSLGIYWPRLSVSTRGQISSFLAEGLRHNRFEAEDIGRQSILSNWLVPTFETLRRWGLEGEDERGRGVLDAVRAEFDNVPDAFGGMVDHIGEMAEAAAVADKEIRYLRGEAGKRADRIKELSEELVPLRDQAQQATDRLSLEQASASAALAAVAEERDSARRIADSLKNEIEAVRASLAAAESAIGQRRHEVDEAIARQRELEDFIARKETAHAEELAALQSANLAEIAQLNATSEREREVAASRLNRMKEEFAALEDRFEKETAMASAKVEAFQAEAQQYGQEAATLRTRTLELRKVAQERVQEVSHLSRMLLEREAEIGGHCRRINAIQGELAAADGFARKMMAQIIGPWEDYSGAMGFIRLRYRRWKLQRSHLFDAVWYAGRYPDVKSAGVDPAIHFIRHGYREGRAPSNDLQFMKQGPRIE